MTQWIRVPSPVQSWVGAPATSPHAQSGPSSSAPPLPTPTDRSSRLPVPVTCPALWELSLNNTLMEKFMKNQIVAAGRELKPFFIPASPGHVCGRHLGSAAHIPSLFMARHPRRHRLQLQFSTNRFWNSPECGALGPPPFPGLPSAPPTGSRSGVLDRASPPPACLLPLPGLGYSKWGHPRQPCHSLYST